MAAPVRPRPFRRWLRRAAFAFLALALIGVAWGLFFPVPLGWAARLAVARALPANDPLQLRIDQAEFRWRWGNPAVLVTVAGIRATEGGQPLARVDQISVELPKAGLRKGNFAPSLVTISAPELTLDQTRPGSVVAAGTAAPAPGASAPAGPPGRVDLAALDQVLPLPGAASKLTLAGLLVHWRTATGETNLALGAIDVTATRDAAGAVKADLGFRLKTGAPAPQLTAQATLDATGTTVGFTLQLPELATNELPVLPGAPLPLSGKIAVEATGRYDLAKGELGQAAGSLLLTEAVIPQPGTGSAPVRIDRAEFRGRFEGATQRAVLETGRVSAGKMTLNVAELTAELGATPRARWQIELTGLEASQLLPLLDAKTRASLPLPAANLATVALRRATLRGNAAAARDAAGTWAAAGVEADGRLELALGSETLQVNFSAAQPTASGPVAVTLNVPPFVPARWPAALLDGTVAEAIDVPLSFQTEASLTPQGGLRSARMNLTGGAGTLRALQQGMPPLAVRRLEVRVEAGPDAVAWDFPAALLELENGARLELASTHAEVTADRMNVKGEARASGLAGDFMVLWLPTDTWKPLQDMGLPPTAVLLERLTAGFEARAVTKAGKWEPEAVSATLSAGLRVRETPLAFTARVSQPQAGGDLEARLELAEFNPARLNLALAEGITSAAMDLPLTVQAVARAKLDGTLIGASLQVSARPGRVELPAPNRATVPVQALTLEAAYDPVRESATVRNLRFESGALRLNLRDVTANLTAPHVVSGRAELEGAPVAALLQLWPETIESDLRREVLPMLRAGQFAGAAFDFGARYDPAAKAPLTISRLQGRAQLSAIEARVPDVPGPVTLGELTATLDYPRANVDLRGIAVPGARIATAGVQLSALDGTEPTMAVTADLTADLAEAARLWELAPAGVMGGRATGALTLRGPLSGGALDGRVTLDLAAMTLALSGLPDAAPSALDLTVRLTDFGAAGKAPVADFRVEAPRWLGEPLRVAGRANFAADLTPTGIDLDSYEHGRTRLQAKWAQPNSNRMDVTLTGSRLDAGPLLRMGLAAADALNPVPPAPVAPPPATPAARTGTATPAAVRPAPATAAVARSGATPAPSIAVAAPVAAAAKTAAPATTLNLSVKVDEVDFAPGQMARQFDLRARLEDNWPTMLNLRSEANAGNVLQLDLSQQAGGDKVKLSIADASGWVRAFTSPWASVSAGTGQYGALVEQVKKVPAIIAGGTVTAEMDLRQNQADWLEGNLRLTKAGLLRAPRVVQLLALKTGRALQTAPLVESFDLGRLTVSDTHVRLAGIALAGPGFLNNLKVQSVSYALANEALAVDGTYFGVGFEVIGTRSDPQVYLKDDNRLLRAIGTRNEFDFFDEAPAAPAKK